MSDAFSHANRHFLSNFPLPVSENARRLPGSELIAHAAIQYFRQNSPALNWPKHTDW
jgi:hypothetical protein